MEDLCSDSPQIARSWPRYVGPQATVPGARTCPIFTVFFKTFSSRIVLCRKIVGLAGQFQTGATRQRCSVRLVIVPRFLMG
jgi:hypothetical protein